MARDGRGDFADRYGPWAVVAGGSEGIGAAYADDLGRRGCNLVLLANDAASLDDIAPRLQRDHGVEVHTVLIDLAADDLVEVVEREVGDREVGLLVYNAAASAIGTFHETDPERLLAAVDVNVRGPVLLARWIAPRLVARGRGGIILMASLAASQGSAMIATYSATKAFNRVLAEGLWEELGRAGVDVLAVTPGSTDTPTYRSSEPRGGPTLDAAEDVARAALDGLGSGPVVVPGLRNRITAVVAQRLLPRSVAIRTFSRVTRSMYGRRG